MGVGATACGRKSIRQFDRISCNCTEVQSSRGISDRTSRATLAFHLLLVRNFVGYLMALFSNRQVPSVGEAIRQRFFVRLKRAVSPPRPASYQAPRAGNGQ